MITRGDGGLWVVSTEAGVAIGVSATREGAERLDSAVSGRSRLLRAKIPGPLFAALEARAAFAEVTLPTYLRAVLEAHVAGVSELVFREPAVGLAAANGATRRRVASSGGIGKRAKRER